MVLYIKIIFFVIWVFLSSFILWHHEMWRDEADVWLMVRDLDFLGWRDYLRHCGHPALWFLLNLPSVLLGFSPMAMQVLNYCFAAIASGKLFFQSKLNPFLTGTILCGVYFLYRFPSFARNYSIGLLLLFFVITGIFHKQKTKRFVAYFALILLVHTHILFTLIAITWGIVLLFEAMNDFELSKERLIAASLLVFSGLLFMYLIFPPNDSQFGNSIIQDNPYAWRISLAYAFLPNLAKNKYAYYLIWIFFTMLGVWTFKYKRIFIYYISGLIFFLCFYRFVYVAHLHHLSVIFAFILSVYWLILSVEDDTSKKFSYAMQGFLFFFAIMQVVYMFTIEIRDIADNYSGSKETVEILKGCGYKELEPIAAHTPDEIKSVLLYLPPKTKLYYPSLKKYGSFMPWNTEYKATYNLKMNDQVRDSLQKSEILFVIVNKSLGDEFKGELEFCGSNDSSHVIDLAETMFVYKRIR